MEVSMVRSRFDRWADAALGAIVCGVCLFPGVCFARIGAYDFACLYGVCGAAIAAVFVSMVCDRGGADA